MLQKEILENKIMGFSSQH